MAETENIIDAKIIVNRRPIQSLIVPATATPAIEPTRAHPTYQPCSISFSPNKVVTCLIVPEITAVSYPNRKPPHAATTARNIIRKTKCSSVLKQNVLFYKTKRTSVNLFSYPNWHKKAPKKYVFFGAFYCSVFWLSHQKSLTLNKYIIFGFNAILIPLKRRYIIPPESWARHRLYSIMSVYVAL